ncbi:MAG: hypothetical protein U1F29_06660 [Planctomycetota bacterium]
MSAPADEHRPERAPRPLGPAGNSLCTTCAHVQRVESAKGSVFWLCGRSKSDPRFPKYPPQPVVSCAGHTR